MKIKDLVKTYVALQILKLIGFIGFVVLLYFIFEV